MAENFENRAADWDKNITRVKQVKIIADEIKRNISLKKGFSGLDFGSGTGLLGFNFIDQAKHFTLIDTSEEMIKQAQKKIIANSYPADALVKDILKDGIDKNFDLIVTMLVLHHIQSYDEIIKKLTGMLSGNGYICIADLVKEDGSFHDGVEVPHNGFKISDIENIFTSLGLEKVSSSIPYYNKREISGKIRKFPVFLIIFKKNTLDFK